MGKFNDTKYTTTIDSLVDATKNKINNPYYVFSDQKPTKVTYYAQNIEKSTLDEASGLYDSHIGSNSPFKFNKIVDFIIYGIDKVAVDYDAGDNGIEAASISGDAVILPNTISPRPGDFFKINYIKEPIIFKVVSVSTDTLDSGANIYKIEYAVGPTESINQIDKQVDKSFIFEVNNVGTDFKSIILDNDFKLIEKLEDLVQQLIVYFENTFFDSKLQTFVYNHDGWNMYDPFLIEFLIRNKVLRSKDKYIFVSHATEPGKTFGMDYSKTFFRFLEDPESINDFTYTATADLIRDPNSLFLTRMNEYYCVKYMDKSLYKTRFQTIDPDVVEHIRSNTLYEKGNDKEIYNLWISYVNNNKDFIRGDILSIIRNIDYLDNLNCFYSLSISIFIIEQYINMLLK